MGFAALVIFLDETNQETQLSSKWLKNISTEPLVNSAIAKSTQKVTQFGMSVFNDEYMDFFFALFENSKQEHSRFQVLFSVDKQRLVYKLALNTLLEKTFSLVLSMVPTKQIYYLCRKRVALCIVAKKRQLVRFRYICLLDLAPRNSIFL